MQEVGAALKQDGTGEQKIPVFLCCVCQCLIVPSVSVFEHLKPHFPCLAAVGHWWNSWILDWSVKDELHFFVLQFSVRLLDNKEWRCGLGHVLKGGTIMSVLLFSLSSYKAWKLALRKAAPCLFPWEWYAPNQAQAILPSWECLLGNAVLFLPVTQSRVSPVENKMVLNRLLLETIICGSLNLLFASCRQCKAVYK